MEEQTRCLFFDVLLLMCSPFLPLLYMWNFESVRYNWTFTSDIKKFISSYGYGG